MSNSEYVPKYNLNEMMAKKKAFLKTPEGIAHAEKERKKEIRRMKFLCNKGIPNQLEKVLNTNPRMRGSVCQVVERYNTLYWEFRSLREDYPDVEIKAPEAKKIIKRMMQKHHPDKGGDPAVFQQVNELYTMLAK